MYKNFLNNFFDYEHIQKDKLSILPKIKRLNVKKIKLKTNRKIYSKKKSILKPISNLELKIITEKAFNNLYGQHYHGQYALKVSDNGLFHLENSFNKYIRYFNKNGRLLKYRAIICKALERFSRIIISKSNEHIKHLTLSEKGQLNFLFYSTQSKNANNLFNWWSYYHHHYFIFKIIKPTKQLKKRKKAKNTIKCFKLPSTAQLSYPLKFLNLYSEEISLRKIEDRIMQSMVNTFITFGDNPIRNRRAKTFLAALRKPSNY